jgi:tetratricopeptide (TPR) repeat protein
MAKGQVLKILIQNRPNALSQPGGDTVVMERTKHGLEKLGVEVTIDLDCKEDLTKYDLVHLFNLATPDYTKALAQRAKAAGIPFVVTTLLEDVQNFHNQSHAWAQYLYSYVQNGQNKDWAAINKPDLSLVPQSQKFENSWTIQNAAGLFVTGPKEGQVISRDYGINLPIYPIYLGCEVSEDISADKFIQAYGVKDFVLCVGRIESRKNQLSLLKALEDVDVPVVIAGSGFTYQPGYAEAVKSFKRRAPTLVLGRLDKEMLASAYCAAKVHALPSFYELPGLVTLEGARYGCNVVASGDSGTIEDYIGAAGFYCNPADENSIRSAVQRALAAPRSETLKQKAKMFSWENLGTQTLAAYRKILNIEVNNTKVLGDKGAFMAPTFDLDTDTTVFQDTLERAELATKAGKTDEAQALFAQAEKLNPNSCRLRMSMGAFHFSNGKIKEAKASFESALDVDSNDVKSLIGRGMCEIFNKSHVTAYGYFVKALQINPLELVGIHQLIECAFVLNRFDESTEIIEKFLAKNPKDAEMRFCLAGCYYKLSKISEAKLELQNVMAQNPNHKGALELSARIANEESKVVATPTIAPTVVASPISETLIVAPPVQQRVDRNIDADMKLAELNEKKRNREIEAVKTGCAELSKIQNLAADQIEFIKILSAEVAILEGALEAAHSIYDVVLKDNPRSARALCGKAALAANSNEWTSAQVMFERALQSDSRCDIAYAGLGMCAAQTQNFPKAWDLYSQALRINPENLRAVLGIIELGYPMKRLAEVEKAVRGYLDLHSADCNFMYSLAGCLFAQEKYSEATEELDRLLMFEPNNQHALELKQLIAPKLGYSMAEMKNIR